MLLIISKLLAIFVIAALLIGVTATVTTFTDSHAVKPSYSGPGNSGQVESPSIVQCQKQSPGNSPCR